MSATEYTDCITFTGETSDFTLKASYKEWDGTVEYSTDHDTWTVWNGTEISSNNKKLYLRGSGNTAFYTSNGAHFVLSARATCSGNIQTLLEYSNPPTSIPANYCYLSMFDGCRNLTAAPELPATTLADYCYMGMFYGCISLVTAPALPATTLAKHCYRVMFQKCTGLVTAPKLPATTLADYCYFYMFYGCTSLKISAAQSSEYSTAWRIPSSGTISSTATSWNNNMLTGTGGTFTSNPSINTTYYGAWTSQETDTSKKLTKLKYKVSDVCQLFDKDKFFATRTAHGVVFTNNGDGSFTINGTCDSDWDADTPLFLPPVDYSITFDLYSIEGHKYLLIPLPQAFSYSALRFVFGTGAVPYYETSNTYEIYTATKTGTYPCYAIYRVGKGTTINNVTVKPQLFDLTEMYGAGNEPTTLAEFRQKYPNDLYPYSPQCWCSINKTRYITPTKNLFNIGLSTNWQPPVNHSYGYVPIFIGIGKTCTISWDLDYYKKHPGTEDIYMCINTGEQPSTSNREWLYHQTIPSLQKSQLTVSANSTGYIYFELANGYNANKEYLQKYLFNENLKWQLELGNQKTDYVPHGYLPLNKGVKL